MSAHIPKFLEWIDDNSELEKYKYFKIPDHHFVLQLFYYEPEEVEVNKKKVNIIGLDGNSASKKSREVLVPYAKVILAGNNNAEFYQNIKPGDIVSLSDQLTEMKVNPQYEMWREIQKERPKPEMQRPPQFIGFISSWYPSQFLLSKLEDAAEENDIMDFTFCRPQSDIKAVVDKEFFNKYRTSEVVQA